MSHELAMTVEITKRSLSATPGALHSTFAAEYQKILEQTKGDRVEAAKLGVRRLHEAHLIREHDVARLDNVCGAILAAARDRTANRQDVFEHVRSVHEKMADASDVARAIVGVAVDSLAPPSHSHATAVARATSNTVDGAIVGGVLGGAIVGGAIGGIGGAIIGAVVGGIGAGIGAACS